MGFLRQILEIYRLIDVEARRFSFGYRSKAEEEMGLQTCRKDTYNLTENNTKNY